MITNQTQYETTKQWVEKFTKSIADLENSLKLMRGELAAQKSVLSELEGQVREYEALRANLEGLAERAKEVKRKWDTQRKQTNVRIEGVCNCEVFEHCPKCDPEYFMEEPDA